MINLRKVYDSVNRAAVLALMQGYGIGPWIRQYVARVWENQDFVLQQTRFYSELLAVERGVTQGNVDLPVIFNLIVDAVLGRLQGDLGEDTVTNSFYADDGLIESANPQELQRNIDPIVKFFAVFGLKANRDKTKLMVLCGSPVPSAQPALVYGRVR